MLWLVGRLKGNAKRTHKLANTLPTNISGKIKLLVFPEVMKAKGPKLFNKPNSGVIAEADFKYMFERPDGDPNFSVEHNRRVIAESIKKNERKMRQIRQDYDKALESRVEAGVDFLRYLANKKYNPNSDSSSDMAMKYFGRRELARLRGEEIKEQIMAELDANKDIVSDLAKLQKN